MDDPSIHDHHITRPASRRANPHDSYAGSHDPAPGGALRARIGQAVDDTRHDKPLAPSLTNYVTINLVANAQLAVGGSAAMSYIPEELRTMMTLSHAGYVNMGTLQRHSPGDIAEVAKDFHDASYRWVLDPVAAGIGETRNTALRSLRATPPTVVRANASEVLALCDLWELGAGITGTPDGVESNDDVDSAAGAATLLARFLSQASPDGRAAVAVSGEVDLVTDGTHTYRLAGGSPMMTRITGAGCSLGGVLACYLAVSDPLTAALTASLIYNRASERAEAICHGPGTFQSAFLDALWSIDTDAVASSPITLI
ncbi:MAG: hydroxyethylthiazole kinase [Bifidobacterium mongoliense]|jgi:hydroxyethylthiazole kinase|uniref:hydroxyethylthiazole kinase n=1 Tax=Bifidobacterium mongoliense TaxID=518643 RepID=UPI002F35D537